MKASGDELTRNQERALLALLSESTMAAAAEKANVAEVTIWRWLQLPAFQTRYRQARRQVVEGAIAGLQQATTEAVACLRDVMSDRTAPAGSRVSAAKAVLDGAIAGVELVELAARIDALEAAVAPSRDSKVRRWAA